jgi:hypothetical protein
MFRNDAVAWANCKYAKGTQVCAACQPRYGSTSRKCDEPTHSVFKIEMVSLNHGGPGTHYYHCEGPTGTVHIYESKIVLVNK